MSSDDINFCLDEISELLFLQEVLICRLVCINEYLAVCVTRYHCNCLAHLIRIQPEVFSCLLHISS